MAWCAADATVVLAAPDALLCLGRNHTGFAFDPRARQLRTPRPLIGLGGLAAAHVALGQQHLAVLTACHRLFTAGFNGHGQLGRPPSSATGVCGLRRVETDFAGTGALARAVACGAAHTLLVLEAPADAGDAGAAGDARNLSVWGCGSNYEGQLAAAAPVCPAFTEIDLGGLRASGGYTTAAARTTRTVRVAAGDHFSVVMLGDLVALAGGGRDLVGQLAAAPPPPAPAAHRLRVPAEQPFRGRTVRHLVAGPTHVLVGCVAAGRDKHTHTLEVFGWGRNDMHQLGLPPTVDFADAPVALPFDCPPQPHSDFPSMLAAASGSSIVVVAGRVWCIGETHADTHSYWDTATLKYTCMDRALFDGLDVAFAGAGRCHAAFVTTCGKIFMQGSLSAVNDNGIPTAARRIRGELKGVCDQSHLWQPRPLPLALFSVPSLPPWVLPAENRLAFLMGTHARLGHSTLVSHLDLLVLRLVIEFADALAPPAMRP
jgi:alpha-tubulin suppressor-like RCC1 family protein